MSFISENIKAARKAAKLKQEDVAAKLNVPRSTYATWEGGADPPMEMIAAVAKVCGYKFRDLVDEDFIDKFSLNEDAPKYKKGRKSLDEIKLVDADALMVKDLLMAKAMLRVVLRTQAEILAAQRDVKVAVVLRELTKAVRDETQEEFDEL